MSNYEPVPIIRTAEPQCEICGCTEAHACPEGCAWDAFFYARGRYVCTSCTIGQDANRTNIILPGDPAWLNL